MKSAQRDKAGGTFDKVRGRLREAGGALTGSEENTQRGRNRQVQGSARKKKGHLRDLFRK